MTNDKDRAIASILEVIEMHKASITRCVTQLVEMRSYESRVLSFDPSKSDLITVKPDRIDIIAARALIERQATALEAGDIDAAIHLGEFVARVSDDGLMRFIEAMRS